MWGLGLGRMGKKTISLPCSQCGLAGLWMNRTETQPPYLDSLTFGDCWRFPRASHFYMCPSTKLRGGCGATISRVALPAGLLPCGSILAAKPHLLWWGGAVKDTGWLSPHSPTLCTILQLSLMTCVPGRPSTFSLSYKF